jgi:hypothetical protein
LIKGLSFWLKDSRVNFFGAAFFQKNQKVFRAFLGFIGFDAFFGFVGFDAFSDL